eukprot:1140104-Pelagomonas_calceolata.AAC.2
MNRYTCLHPQATTGHARLQLWTTGAQACCKYCGHGRVPELAKACDVTVAEGRPACQGMRCHSGRGCAELQAGQLAEA